MRLIKYEGIDFEAKLITRKVPVCRKNEAVFITKEKIFLSEIRYQNLRLKGFEIVKFKNILEGFTRNILGGVEDKNFEILKQGKAVVLKIIFQESATINKLEALNLLDIIRSLLLEFEVDIREIKEKY